MATSGAALQLAIAPAGSGKTTAMQALATAWTNAGGTTIGLAPSAAAAAGLGAQTGSDAHTLAALTWALARGDVPHWAADVDERTLVIIDEAAMAATLDLDAAVTYLTGRGASVRLIGDDQQLAAIGAGGVLRDIAAAQGALELTDVVRFDDPSEAAASIALRDGHHEATAFYADHDRIHVGDLDALADDSFTGWLTDRLAGLDAIMIAPTRDLVRDLNQRARAHRLTDAPLEPGQPVARLADGNTASAGDLIITRRNERRLSYGRHDWVKNGDRFRILTVTPAGALNVEHVPTGRTLTLPATYVREAVDLGYAATVHTVQGVTADTMHGIATGEMTRQQQYTMLTRGRRANHLYLDSAVTGDPEHIIRPAYRHPPSPTDILHALIARDGSPPRPPPSTGKRPTRAPSSVPPPTSTPTPSPSPSPTPPTPTCCTGSPPSRNSSAPASPPCRPGRHPQAELLLLAADHADAEQVLTDAITTQPLNDAADPAAVLAWRLPRSAGRGPLPWLHPRPGHPARPPHLGHLPGPPGSARRRPRRRRPRARPATGRRRRG